MKFNCDLGEGLDELDALLMPHIHQASIACGGHAGNTRSMTRCVRLALEHKVSIGAHPSYPDREYFGRRSLTLSDLALAEALQEQVENLRSVCRRQAATLDYIKAHGALYSDAVIEPSRFEVLISLARKYELPLMVQALPAMPQHFQTARPSELILEAFADRAYENNGQLVARSKKGAVLEDTDKVLAQVKTLVTQKGVASVMGKWLALNPQSVCFHSDSPKALESLIAVRQQLKD